MIVTRLSTAAALTLLLALAPACAKSGGHATKGAASAEADEPEPFGRLTVDELDRKIAAAKAGQEKLALFDNNIRERFDKGHIPGAKWIKFDAVTAAELPADKDTTLVFYCANEH